MLNSKFFFRLFLGVLLAGAGFFAGVSWTNREQPAETGADQPGQSKLVNLSAGAEEGLTDDEIHNIRLFEQAAPSVCFITTTNVTRDFWTRNIMEIPRGTGSGFVWDDEGHIVTNYHVIEDADKAQVTLADQSVWDATLVGIAPEKDLAVLRIKAPAGSLFPIPIGTSANLRVGQSVYAIGNPFGLDQTLTTGVVSALGREIESRTGTPIRDAIQSDAAINPGNSGGPLLNSSGKLIGVNTAIYSPSGASAGIGFSIPVDVVRWVVPELIEFKRIRRPSLGVELLDQSIARRWGVDGAVIVKVAPGGPAEKAGFQPTYRDRYGRILLGDIIVGINDEKIKSEGDFILALEKYNPGDQVEVRIIREEKEKSVKVQLADWN